MVVVPRSLQPPSPSPPKGYLDRVTWRDLVIILILTLIAGVAAAHYYKVVDLNEMLEVVKSNLKLPESTPAPTTTSTSTPPPSTTVQPPTAAKP